MRQEGIYIEEIMKEIAWCMTFDQAETCLGASGRKLRQTCVWCPRLKKREGNNDGRGDEGDSGKSTSPAEQIG